MDLSQCVVLFRSDRVLGVQMGDEDLRQIEIRQGGNPVPGHGSRPVRHPPSPVSIREYSSPTTTATEGPNRSGR